MTPDDPQYSRMQQLMPDDPLVHQIMTDTGPPQGQQVTAIDTLQCAYAGRF